MQGIFIPPEQAAEFPDTLLRDLAGNSFNTWNIVPCTLALLFTTAELEFDKNNKPDWLSMMGA